MGKILILDISQQVLSQSKVVNWKSKLPQMDSDYWKRSHADRSMVVLHIRIKNRIKIQDSDSALIRYTRTHSHWYLHYFPLFSALQALQMQPYADLFVTGFLYHLPLFPGAISLICYKPAIKIRLACLTYYMIWSTAYAHAGNPIDRVPLRYHSSFEGRGFRVILLFK